MAEAADNEKTKSVASEGRMAWLRETYSAKLMRAATKFKENESCRDWAKDGKDDAERERNLFDRVAESDPTPKKIYLQWLLKRICKGRVFLEDLGVVKDNLADFDRYKRLLPEEGRDINHYGMPSDVWEAVNGFAQAGAASSGKDESRREREAALAASEIVWRGESGAIIAIPKTQAASKWWGRGTRWCTAANSNNMFRSYSNDGPLYVIVLADGRKYQMHVHSNSLMNSADRRAPISEILDAEPEAWLPLKPVFCEMLRNTGKISHFEGLPDGYKDAKVCFNAIKGDAENILKVPDGVLTPEMVSMAVMAKPALAAELPKEAFNDSAVMALAAVDPGQTLEKFGDSMLDDVEVIHALKEWPERAKHVSRERFNDRFADAVMQVATGYEHLPAGFKTRERLLAAVKGDGLQVAHAPEANIDSEVAVLAARQCAEAVLHLPDALIDEAVRDAAVKGEVRSKEKAKDVLARFPSGLRDEAICEMCLSNTDSLVDTFRLIPKESRNARILEIAAKSPELVIMAAKSAGLPAWVSGLRSGSIKFRDVPKEQHCDEVYGAAIMGGSLGFEQVPEEGRGPMTMVGAVMSKAIHPSRADFGGLSVEVAQDLVRKVPLAYLYLPSDLRVREVTKAARENLRLGRGFVRETDDMIEDACKFANRHLGNIKKGKVDVESVIRDGSATLGIIPPDMLDHETLVVAMEAHKHQQSSGTRFTRRKLYEIPRDLSFLSLVPKRLWTPKIVEQAVQLDSKAIAFVPDDMLTEGIIIDTVKNGGFHGSFMDIPERFRTRDVAEQYALRHHYRIKTIPEAMREKDLYLKVLRERTVYATGLHVSDGFEIPEEYIDDEIANLMIKYDVKFLPMMPERYKSDIEFIEKAFTGSEDRLRSYQAAEVIADLYKNACKRRGLGIQEIAAQLGMSLAGRNFHAPTIMKKVVGDKDETPVLTPAELVAILPYRLNPKDYIDRVDVQEISRGEWEAILTYEASLVTMVPHDMIDERIVATAAVNRGGMSKTEMASMVPPSLASVAKRSDSVLKDMLKAEETVAAAGMRP